MDILSKWTFESQQIPSINLSSFLVSQWEAQYSSFHITNTPMSCGLCYKIFKDIWNTTTVFTAPGGGTWSFWSPQLFVGNIIFVGNVSFIWQLGTIVVKVKYRSYGWRSFFFLHHRKCQCFPLFGNPHGPEKISVNSIKVPISVSPNSSHQDPSPTNANSLKSLSLLLSNILLFWSLIEDILGNTIHSWWNLKKLLSFLPLVIEKLVTELNWWQQLPGVYRKV